LFGEIALDMSDASPSLFLLAAVIIAIIPGPGIFYVTARTLSGGRKAGIASTFGTALGGLVHVIAGGLGVSAIILASAQLFTVLKLVGALYLIWLGIRTFREAGNLPLERTNPDGAQRAFQEGVVVEALNPKTAAFFLAFIPQFLDPTAGHPAFQFMALGLISVTLNTFADVIVVVVASAARAHLVRRPTFVQRLRQGSGLFMAGLGLSLVLARRPATSQLNTPACTHHWG
jgi:threonine/homoserine/homoserine lactone efflux protein